MRFRLMSLALVLAGACSSPGPEINLPPSVISARPSEGDILQPNAAGPRLEVAVTLADQNLEDHLFIRWFLDYPGSDNSASREIREDEIPPSGLPVRLADRILAQCDFLKLPPGQHRLVMSASDRPYLDPQKGEDVDPNAPLDSVPADANRLRLVWILDCP
jgi:hypothetical protein